MEAFVNFVASMLVLGIVVCWFVWYFKTPAPPASLTEPFGYLRAQSDPRGQVWHPDLPERGEGVDILAELKRRGFIGCWIEGAVDDHFTHEASRLGGMAYFEEMATWKPNAPDLNPAWRLAAKMDSEDGPVALFVCPLDKYWHMEPLRSSEFGTKSSSGENPDAGGDFNPNLFEVTVTGLQSKARTYASDAVCRAPASPASPAAALQFSTDAIERTDTGEFWHPDLLALEEVDRTLQGLAARGYEGRWVYGGETDFPEPVCIEGGVAYWNAMRQWQPEPPNGTDWKLAAITDTDDGAAALFVRPFDSWDNVERFEEVGDDR